MVLIRFGTQTPGKFLVLKAIREQIIKKVNDPHAIQHLNLGDYNGIWDYISMSRGIAYFFIYL